MNIEGKYKKNKIEKNKSHYKQEDVINALNTVKRGVSTWKASVEFNVPRSTIYSKLKGIIPIKARKGPSTYLSKEEEQTVVKWVLYCAGKGFPITKIDLLEVVQTLVRTLKKKAPFKNDKPGRHWFESFLKRHSVISQRLAQNLSLSRACVTESALRKWFSEIEDHLKTKNLLNVHPSRFFNCDESAFFFVPKPGRVLARRGAKAVYRVAPGDEKESLTVLFTVNAEGTMLPPMILFWYERIPLKIMENLPQHWVVGNTQSGWMTAESFCTYIQYHFYPWLLANRIQLPIILFLDGHVSHMSLDVAKFCNEHEIELIALHPNATHIYQPLDVAVFHILKNTWSGVVDQWKQMTNTNLKRDTFASALQESLKRITNLEKTIKNGFKTCGLHPFSADALDYDIFNKKHKSKNKLDDKNIADNSEICAEATTNLCCLENFVGPEILKEFKEIRAGQKNQISKQENKGLFNYWSELHKYSGNSDNAQDIIDPSVHTFNFNPENVVLFNCSKRTKQSYLNCDETHEKLQLLTMDVKNSLIEQGDTTNFDINNMEILNVEDVSEYALDHSFEIFKIPNEGDLSIQAIEETMLNDKVIALKASYENELSSAAKETVSCISHDLHLNSENKGVFNECNNKQNESHGIAPLLTADAVSTQVSTISEEFYKTLGISNKNFKKEKCPVKSFKMPIEDLNINIIEKSTIDCVDQFTIKPNTSFCEKENVLQKSYLYSDIPQAVDLSLQNNKEYKLTLKETMNITNLITLDQDKSKDIRQLLVWPDVVKKPQKKGKKKLKLQV